MKSMKLYASWGILAHEFRPVYTADGPRSEAYDIVHVKWPEGFPLSRNYLGEWLIDVGECVYLLRDVLTNWGDDPALIWRDDRGVHRVMLEVITHPDCPEPTP